MNIGVLNGKNEPYFTTINNINTFMPILPAMRKLYPIPKEYENNAKYCRVAFDAKKAFYYDINKKFLCEVSQIDVHVSK